LYVRLLISLLFSEMYNLSNNSVSLESSWSAATEFKKKKLIKKISLKNFIATE